MKSNRSTNNTKKTRIAQVLAHARYEVSDDYQPIQEQSSLLQQTLLSSTFSIGNESISLEYPSRPYTPASYDERITLDSNLNNKLSNNNSRKSKTSNTSSFLHKQLKENLSLSRDSFNSSNSNITKNDNNNHDTYKIDNNSNNSIKNNSSYSSKIIVIIKPLINDLKDIEMNIQDTRADVILNIITLPMDSLSKILRDIISVSDFNAEMISDIESLSSCLVSIVQQLIHQEISSYSNTNIDFQYILVLIKYTLKILILQLTFTNSISDTNNSNNALSFDNHQLSFHLKETTHYLYQLCTLSINKSTSRLDFKLQLVTSTSSSLYMDRNNEYKDDISIDDQDFDSNVLRLSTSNINNADSDTFTLACADLLLKLIQLLWEGLPSELICLYEHIIAINQKKRDGDNHSIESSILIRYTSLVNRYLQSISYSTAILRIISSNEIDSKRLIHAGTLKVLKKGLLFYQKNEVLLRFIKQIIPSTISTSNITTNSSTSIASNVLNNHMIKTKCSELVKELINTAVQSMIQILGIIRNFSVEKYGRTQIEQYELVGCFCQLPSIYSSYPLVILNTARIIAKLSLIESFRSQINSNAFHTECLVNVIMQQSILCKQIMEGTVPITNNTTNTTVTVSNEAQEEDEEGEEDLSWPYWYTWPLITRICFILGNLTTTNIEQRKLIGIEYDLVDHILLLLQACAESLYQLQQTKSLYDTDNKDNNMNKDNTTTNTESKEDDFNDGASQNENADQSHNNQDDDTGEKDLRDATIKLVRLLVNLTIEEQIGHLLADRKDIYQMLVKLLSSATNEIDPHEELLLNVIAACTNVTYYSNCYSTNNVVGDKVDVIDMMGKKYLHSSKVYDVSVVGMKTDQQLVELTIHIGHCLFHNNLEIVLETARVLGNLSRNYYARKSVIKHRTDEALLLLLAHGQPDVLSAITGVFINLTSDKQCRILLLKPSHINIIQTFSELLRRMSFKDIQLAILICQVIYNLICSHQGLITTTNNNTLLNEDESLLMNEYLSNDLKDYLYDTLLELSECAYDISRTTTTTNNNSNNKSYEIFYKIAISIMLMLDENNNVPTIFGWHGY